MYALELAGQDDAFAAYEAGSAASDVAVVAPGLAVAETVTDRLEDLAFTHRASELLERTAATAESARDALEGASIERQGSVAVRARGVRGTDVDTQKVERELGSVLVDRGFSIDLDDPDHELRAVFSADVCLLGWLAFESVRGYGSRRPTDRPFFQPGSMDPLLARAVVNIAGAKPGTRILDPMCGTGGILIEAGLVGASVLGIDAQSKMVRGTRRNLAAALDAERYDVAIGDATAMPVRDEGVDAVVFDAPYGRQSKIAHRDLDGLVGGALVEARRVAERGVLVADRSWSSSSRAAGWEVEATFERRVHRSLTRYVHVLR